MIRTLLTFARRLALAAGLFGLVGNAQAADDFLPAKRPSSRTAEFANGN